MGAFIAACFLLFAHVRNGLEASSLYDRAEEAYRAALLDETGASAKYQLARFNALSAKGVSYALFSEGCLLAVIVLFCLEKGAIINAVRQIIAFLP